MVQITTATRTQTTAIFITETTPRQNDNHVLPNLISQIKLGRQWIFDEMTYLGILDLNIEFIQATVANA